MSDSAGAGRGPDRNASERTSASLLEQVRAGNGQAWQRFVDLYGPVIYGWCRRCSLRAEDAADVVQEVFGAVALHVRDFRRSRPGDSFRGWLWTITRNKVRDLGRRQRHLPSEGGTAAQQRLAQIPDHLPANEPDAEDACNGDGLVHRAIELVRAGVEPRTWEAFWRLTAEERPVADVAQELGMSVRAVYEAKYRVRRRIRQELADLLE